MLKLILAHNNTKVAGFAGLGLVTALGALLVILIALPASSGASEVSLKGVPPAQLQEAGIELTTPDGSPAISSEQAEAVVPTVRPGAKIIEAVLVNLTQRDEKESELAWAISLQPDSVQMELHPPPGFVYPSPTTIFAVVFVDAKTGELISAPALADPGGTPIKAAAD